MWSPYEGLNTVMALLSHKSGDMRIGATLAVGLMNNGIVNPSEDLALNTLYSQLSTPLQPSASASATAQYSASLLALALAYANTARDDLLPFLLGALKTAPHEVGVDTSSQTKTAAAAAVASGLIFCGRQTKELVEAICLRVKEEKPETEGTVSSLMLGLGLSMLFTVRVSESVEGKGSQKEWNDLQELPGLQELPPRYATFLRVCLLGCSFLGSQNILIIHQLLELLSREETELEEKARQKKKEDTKEKEEKEETVTSPLGMSSFAGLLMPQRPSVSSKEAEAKAKEGTCSRSVSSRQRVSPQDDSAGDRDDRSG